LSVGLQCQSPSRILRHRGTAKHITDPHGRVRLTANALFANEDTWAPFYPAALIQL